jgi:hypothetical protein
MGSVTDREVLGDWSNLKGSRYHLAYAIWLLLQDRASEVAFFEGNDLLAHPAPPRVQDGEVDAAPPIPMVATHGEMDIWIQLKSTRSPWTVSELLGENLLFNFICNTIISERRQRPWEVVLITEAEVRSNAIRDFVADPESKSGNNEDLEVIVERARVALEEKFGVPITAAALRQRAVQILASLADTQPVALDTLKAEIELEIAYACPDRTAAKRIASTLVGAMLEDAVAGPSHARRYTVAWLHEVAGRVIKSTKPFDADAFAACDLAIVDVVGQRELPAYDPSKHVRRARLEVALEQFISGPECLFVLLGSSGTGKSWTMADWALSALRGRVRLLTTGPDLEVAQTLGRLVADYFAPYTERVWRDEDRLARLAAAASGSGRGPLLVIIDDLRVPQMAVEEYQRLLARLVARAQQIDAKLIFTCQLGTWHLYRLHAEIPATWIYDPNRGPSTGPVTHSFILGEFTPEELSDAAERRLPADSAGRVRRAVLQLRSASFIPLRNPFLLDRYIEQHGNQLGLAQHPPDPVDVDALLAGQVTSRLDRAAAILHCDMESVRAAFNDLIGSLWDNRSAGLRHAAAVAALDQNLPGEGPQALNALRRSGLLNTHGPVRIAEGAVADHLFSSLMLAATQYGEEILADLHPTRDASATQALIRQSPDRVMLAETLLRRDVRWISVVADGLAQGPPHDLRIVALAASLTRPRGDSFVDHDGCRSFGLLIARGRRARRRAMEMYLSDDHAESLRGAESLAAAFELVPTKVGVLVRFRLGVELRRQGRDAERRRARRLADALGPLQHVNHRDAAKVASGILRDYGPLMEDRRWPESHVLIDAMDYIRGRAAPFEEEQSLAALLNEVLSGDRSTRLRAAAALRPAAYEVPERVSEAVCTAIRSEQDAHVLLRLLWASYRVLEVSCEEMLAAIAASVAVRWDDPVPTGPALVLLGSAAVRHAQVVFRLLPQRLERLPPWARACLSDVLAWAWWHCAEHEPGAREHLAALTRPDVAEVPKVFQVFANRGAAIAQLGLACLDRISVAEVSVSMTRHDGGNLPYLFSETGELFRQNAASLVASPGSAGLAEALQACVNAEAVVQPDPRDDALLSARHICSRDCLDALVQLAAHQADPLLLLQGLPRDWQALYAVRNLIEMGCRAPVIAEFARQACQERARSGTFHAFHERDLCLAQLSLLNPDPRAALARHQTEVSPSLFGQMGGGHAQGMTSLIDAHPRNLLSLLDAGVSDLDSIPILVDWEKQCRSWQALVISGVFARMFNPRSVRRIEAQRLTSQMLEAVHSLPTTSHRAEYEVVFGAISSWWEGFPVTISPPDRPDSPIRRSYAMAAELLDRAAQARRANEPPQWLVDLVADRRCWWESMRHQLRNGSLSVGSGGDMHLIYCFPAVRLACAAVGWTYRLTDPVGTFMTDRYRVTRVLADIKSMLMFRKDRVDVLERAYAKLESSLASGVRDERLFAVGGNLLLRMGQIGTAEEHLRRCLQLASCSEDTRASALYDLACVLARTGHTEKCRDSLLQALRLRPAFRRQLTDDTDFDGVRGTAWFEEFLSNSPDIT